MLDKINEQPIQKLSLYFIFTPDFVKLMRYLHELFQPYSTTLYLPIWLGYRIELFRVVIVTKEK